MIGETMMKCKYIDPKKAKLQTEMCLVLLVTAYNQLSWYHYTKNEYH
jgi:hypothetical protein